MNTIRTQKNRGRPLKYLSEEERKKACTAIKTKYMLNKEWYCDVCRNNKNYSLAGKTCHLRTKKHLTNTLL